MTRRDFIGGSVAMMGALVEEPALAAKGAESCRAAAPFRLGVVGFCALVRGIVV